MSDVRTENLEHQHIVDLVRAFSKDANDKGKCNGFTSMWLQAVLTGEKEEQAYYERLNRLARYLPGSNICLMKELPENPLANPESVKGNIYLTKEGDYIVYTEALDGSGWVEHKGTLFEFIKPDNEEFKKILSKLEAEYSDASYKEAMSLVVNKVFSKKIAQEVDKIFKSKIYNLFLITDKISKGELPAENEIYFEKNDNKLKYIVLDKNDKTKVVSAEVEIDLGNEVLTSERLEKLRSEILRKTSAIGHTRSVEENQLTEAQLNVVEMRAFAENIFVQQDPSQTEVFDTFISQDNKSVLFLLTQSRAQGEKSINHVDLGAFVGNKKDLETYFSEIERTVADRGATEGAERVTFLLSSDNHSVGVYFDEKSKKWHFMDVNRLSGKKTYYADVNSAELADHLFDSYFDDKKGNTTFTITRLSMNPKSENDLIDEKVKMLSKNILAKKHSFFLPDKKNKRGSNAMFLAAGMGQKEMVDILIKNSASVNHKNDDGLTPLMMAVQNGHTEVVKDLFKAGAKEDKSKNNVGATLLMIAARLGHTDIVKLLIDRKNDVNEKNNLGLTAIMIAVIGRQFDIIDILLDSGANINDQTEKGQSALMMAIGKQDLEMVEFLLKKGANLGVKDKVEGSAFLYAVMSNNPAMVSLFLEHDPNITKITDPKEKNALKIAIDSVSPDTDFSDMLPDRKALFSIIDSLIAKETDQNEIKQALESLKNNLRKNVVSDLLSDMIVNGFTNIAKAIIDISENNTFVAFDLVTAATYNNNLKELLLKEKDKLKDLNSQTRLGYPILCYYVKSHNIKAVQVLVEAGIDLNKTIEDSRRIKNKDEVGKTALSLAEEMAKDPSNDMVAMIDLLSNAFKNTQTVTAKPSDEKSAVIFSQPKEEAPVAIKMAEPRSPRVKPAVIFTQTIEAAEDLKSAVAQLKASPSPKSAGEKPPALVTPLSQAKAQTQSPIKREGGASAGSVANAPDEDKGPQSPASKG